MIVLSLTTLTKVSTVTVIYYFVKSFKSTETHSVTVHWKLNQQYQLTGHIRLCCTSIQSESLLQKVRAFTKSRMKEKGMCNHYPESTILCEMHMVMKLEFQHGYTEESLLYMDTLGPE